MMSSNTHLLFGAFSFREPVPTPDQVRGRLSLENASFGNGMDQRQRRQQIQMRSIAQCQPQVSGGEARVLAHDRLRSRPFPILNRVNDHI